MSDLDSIFESHAVTVWRIAYRLLNDESDAQDCYQQTFLDAMGLDPRSVHNWSAVLRRIVTRRAFDALRQRYKHRSHFIPLEVDPDGDASPQSEMQFDELRVSVRQALAELPYLQADEFCRDVGSAGVNLMISCDASRNRRKFRSGSEV